jgi:hypothetical protein
VFQTFLGSDLFTYFVDYLGAFEGKGVEYGSVEPCFAEESLSRNNPKLP